MIILIILLILLIVLLIAMLVDRHKNPEAYRAVEEAARKKKKRRRPRSEYEYTGLPWMGGKRVRRK